jgi:regulation of enolase protein 1 (concanavalin A-like superfamily)
MSWVPVSSQRAADSPLQTELVEGREAAAGEVLAKFRGALPSEVPTLVDAAVVHPLPTGAYRIRSRSRTTANLVASLTGRPDVMYVEPNYVVRGSAVSNDPFLPNEWFLHNSSMPGADISASGAWEVTTGSTAFVVAVIDSGIDHRHVDLVGNLWTAPSAYTINVNGTPVTCPAGSHGFDTITGSCDAVDAAGHGTAMAGIIGAVGNNATGGVGVNWRTSIMDLRFLGGDNRGFVSDAITSIDVALQLKTIFGAAANVRVLSNSWGADEGSLALRDAVARTTPANVLFVAAAMNDSRDLDVWPRFPAAYPLANVVAVAATTRSDGLASFSNYGASTVHLGAPGDNIQTTAPGNSYLGSTGTSPATAVVSGVAALVLSACPVDTAQLKDTLLQTVDPVAALAGKTITGGRVNADAALRRCTGGSQPLSVTITTPAAQTHFVAPATIAITADASDADGQVTQVEFYADGARLGSASTPPYTFSWTNVAAGSYSLSAIATDNRGRMASSPVIDCIFVDPPDTPVSSSPWAATDIGPTGLTGSASCRSGVFNVRGGGADVWGTADAFQYVYQPLNGDGTIVARVASVENVAPWTKAGVMIRNTLSPSSAHAFMLVSAGKGFAFQRRTIDGGTSMSTSAGLGVAPQWVRLSRAGQTITAAISADGAAWTTIGQDTFAMAPTVYVGLAVSSHDTTHLAQATFESVLVTAVTAASLPAGWDHSDVGTVGPEGSAAESAGMFTIEGAGADIWNSADAFHYAYLRLSGDVAIVSRVTSVETVAPWTKAGVMIRETLSPSSAHAMMLVSAGKGFAFQRRTSTDGLSTSTPAGTGVAPQWLKLTRTGQTIAASISTDGATWTEIGRDTFSMGAGVYVGLAVSSHDATRTATATFDHVSAAQIAPLPQGWTASDVGSVGVAGSAQESAGTFTVSGAGADVWSTADAFHYAYTPLSGDGSIVARVDSVENVAAWTKAGVMIRASLDPGSPQAFMLISAGKGLAFQRRVAAGGLSTSTPGDAPTAPQWVKLVRDGQTISAWASADGVAWMFVGQDTFSMAANAYVGLAVSSHDATRLARATFTNVTRTP